MIWNDEIRAVFPNWDTDIALEQWPTVRLSLSVGQIISGRVISKAPFGVWLDIGVAFPALLLVVNMAEAKGRKIACEEFPNIGSSVSGRINVLGDQGEIGITQ